MISPSFVFLLIVGTVCSFCGEDFVSLGRHAWRCRQRVHQGDQPHYNNNAQQIPVINSVGSAITNTNAIKCCCGKVCKGNRGLKMHQRSCRVVSGLNDELRADSEMTSDHESEEQDWEVPTTFLEEDIFPDIKNGINLPKSDSQWLTANEYFKSVLNLNPPITFQDLNSSIKLLNDTIYDYFSTNYGQVQQAVDENLIMKYRDKTTKELKKALKDLKRSDANLTEIKYVSRLLRDNLRKRNDETQDSLNQINHDVCIAKSFWGYVKKIFVKKDAVLPSFSMAECLGYFKKSLSSINPMKVFRRPSWIPTLSDPEIPFNLDPPTYEQISRVIRKMKASGSPCPLDQLSVICFKRCPFLRTYLTEIIRSVWSSGSVPIEWKRACTILIHKKGNTDDPANFRPITLQSVPLKIFTSCLRNSIFNFLAVNNFIEHEIQKGFTPGLSGTLEHTAQMANIINKARIKQRSLVITLLDLKNAFGEVHHNLIQTVLDYHHIPDHIKLLIKSLYTDFKTSIITPGFRTPFVSVGRGVLQGDCLSPLLFNLCFNTFIQHIKSEKYRQFGFSCKFLNPLHWFQFADDAAVISGQESENQHLLNRFTIWCQWSNMIIRVDKCCTFGMKKLSTKSVQYLPKLLINSVLVPCVKIGESFRYLGRFFDFDMSNQDHMTELTTLVRDLMSDIDMKPLHPKNKLMLYSRYVLSKLSWHLTVSDITKTWITENLDSLVNQYLRKWLEIPISGTLSNTFLPRNKFGLNIIPPSIKFIQCQTVLRNALKNSRNDSIQALWKTSSNYTNIQYDVYRSTKEVLKDFRANQEDKLQHQLISQGFFFSNVIKFSLQSLNSVWSSAQSSLPKNIYNFTIRYINNSLPTRKNLTKWAISPSSECSFCFKPETLLHVVAGCQYYLERFTWRHNSVLNFLATTLQPINSSTLYADIDGFNNPSVITGDAHRPDLVLLTSSGCLYVLELTVGFESNLKNNIERKKEKYKNTVKSLSSEFKDVKFVNLSISCLGVFAKECSAFIEMIQDLGFDKRHQKYIISKIVNIAVRSTYYIFCCRNKAWDNPELMKF